MNKNCVAKGDFPWSIVQNNENDKNFSSNKNARTHSHQRNEEEKTNVLNENLEFS